ncbi:IS3 family transposase [Persicimonas caeni]|uniref:IS3 family transposase n=1 Tax=Persicimonas caeni TaxID=2292766 RepID=A0A4Y6PRC6_PERCE|nr:IS3 family transposase [Persicimonas caeni]QDG50121.1 IS3 family transposase [Persicimonas caeni]QDG50894.1 IS3 family transposase [Persicimonas caeni]QDG51339.1 IS3 family transposase [Persicimonas caeni]QDG51424.1 IS3 family transposase [Persicimonas caeni]QDG51894.1 IS3 family transposase [Persicimonas caeni]
MIAEAVSHGARQAQACRTLGISERTIQRWRKDPQAEDARQGPHSRCAHALTDEERAQVVAIATGREFCDVSPRQIVCSLADRGEYVASESTFYRVLREEKMMTHRQPSRPPKPRPKPELVAASPGQVWVWDITYLPTQVRGRFVYLYWIMDLFSRKIVGFSVEDQESMELSSRLIEKTILAEQVEASGLCIHADNGAAMKGSTLLATLERLEVAASFSRPGVSNDNPHCESSFRTLKYRPGYPKKPLDGVHEWSEWVEAFVRWYNTEHYHSGIGWVTPEQRHAGEDVELLQRRQKLYEQARQKNPARWSRRPRGWTRPEEVRLAPLNLQET